MIRTKYINSPKDMWGDFVTLETWTSRPNEPRFALLNSHDMALLTKEQMVAFLKECIEYLEAKE